MFVFSVPAVSQFPAAVKLASAAGFDSLLSAGLGNAQTQPIAHLTLAGQGHPACAELVSNLQLGRLGGVVLSQWTIGAGWNVQSRQRGLASREIPVTKRTIVKRTDIHVWERAHSRPEYTVLRVKVLLAGVCNGAILMCGKDMMMQATPKMCWKTFSPALTTHISEKEACEPFYGTSILLTVFHTPCRGARYYRACMRTLEASKGCNVS